MGDVRLEEPISDFKNIRIIGGYSLGGFNEEGEHEIFFDETHLNSLKLHWDLNAQKEVEFDLKKRSGELKTYECEKWSAEKLDSLLRWILKNKNKDPLKKFLIDASSTTPEGKNRKIVTHRGLLKDWMSLVYSSSRKKIEVLATKFKGIIYLSKLRTVNYKNGEEVPKDPVEETRGKSIGTKFEQYMAHGEDVELHDSDENAAYSSVVHSEFGSSSLIYIAEQDGYDPTTFDAQNMRPEMFIELKSKLYRNYKDQPRQNFRGNKRFKSYQGPRSPRLNASHIKNGFDINGLVSFLSKFNFMDWWLQCYLAGIQRLIVGFRNTDEKVKYLKMFDVRELLEKGKAHWRKEPMLKELDDFLGQVEKILDKDDPRLVYKISTRLTSERSWRPSKIEFVTEVCEDEFLLPEWYTEKIDELLTGSK